MFKARFRSCRFPIPNPRSRMASSSAAVGNGEARMLERRVSNNRADLDGDQRMNYFLSWFDKWSDLQKSDFLPILAQACQMAADGDGNGNCYASVNGRDGESSKVRKALPSLFECQIKLFKEWFGSWSDDQKSYLTLRLQATDPGFYSKFEDYSTDPDSFLRPPKDYFEPGVPAEMVRKSSRCSVSAPPHHLLNLKQEGQEAQAVAEEVHEDDDDKDDENIQPTPPHLETIVEQPAE